jgi:hypothetical protein
MPRSAPAVYNVATNGHVAIDAATRCLGVSFRSPHISHSRTGAEQDRAVLAGHLDGALADVCRAIAVAVALVMGVQRLVQVDQVGSGNPQDRQPSINRGRPMKVGILLFLLAGSIVLGVIRWFRGGSFLPEPPGEDRHVMDQRRSVVARNAGRCDGGSVQASAESGAIPQVGA